MIDFVFVSADLRAYEEARRSSGPVREEWAARIPAEAQVFFGRRV